MIAAGVWNSRTRRTLPSWAFLLFFIVGCAPDEPSAPASVPEVGQIAPGSSVPGAAAPIPAAEDLPQIVSERVPAFAVLGNGVRIAPGDPPSLETHTDFGSTAQCSLTAFPQPGPMEIQFVMGLRQSTETSCGPLFAHIATLRMVARNDAQGQDGPSRIPYVPLRLDEASVRSFTIRNDGGADLAVEAVDVPEGFLLAQIPSPSLAPGESTSFQISLDYRHEGIRSGNIAVGVRSEGGALETFVFAVRGVVTSAEPRIVVLGDGHSIQPDDLSPTLADSTDFGAISQNTEAIFSTRTFTIYNAGGSELLLGEIGVPEGFRLVSLLPAGLPPGRSGTIRVILDSESQGLRSGTIRIASNDPRYDSFVFAVQGYITEPQPARVGVFGNDRNIVNRSAVADEELHTDFGRVFHGEMPIVRTFVIRNTGGEGLTLQDIAVPDGFAVIDAPDGPIAPGEAGSLRVQLDTESVGYRAGEISFHHDAVNLNPFVFPIHGWVVEPAPVIGVSMNGVSVDPQRTTSMPQGATGFGNVLQGAETVFRVLTVRNDGVLPLTVGDVRVPEGFVLLSEPAPVVAPGETTQFRVQMDLSEVGTRSGQIRIHSNDAEQNPFVFAVGGFVQAPGYARIAVLGNGVGIPRGDTMPNLAKRTDFGSVEEGGAPVVRRFTVRNSGSSPLTLGTVHVPPGFTLVVPPAVTVEPGGETFFEVRLDAQAAGFKAGEIAFEHDAADPSPFHFAIRGVVAGPAPGNSG